MSAPGTDSGASALSAEVLAAAFEALPASVCFIDANRVIRYVSTYAIFSGYSPALVGSDVLDCHSNTTREPIMRMLDEFASGSADDVSHLTEKRGRPVRITYRAVRGVDGAYLGCLEVGLWMDGED